jgi:SAM-dependent methyltransferase
MTESTTPFYSRRGLHVEIYDVQTGKEWGEPRCDASFYLEEAKSTAGPVLELGCGTGRLMIPLVETGLEIHGLDASAAMLEAAKHKRDQLSSETAKRMHLHLGDMAQFDLKQKFAFIYIAFRSFQILSTPEIQRQCLACIHKHLTSRGKLIINLFDPRYDMIMPGRQESTQPTREFVHPVSGNRVVVETLERIVDPLGQTFEERWRFTENGPDGDTLRQEEEHLKLRWTFRYEMRHLVESCGFVVEAEYSDFHRSPPAYGKEQVWVLRAV